MIEVRIDLDRDGNEAGNGKLVRKDVLQCTPQAVGDATLLLQSLVGRLPALSNDHGVETSSPD